MVLDETFFVQFVTHVVSTALGCREDNRPVVLVRHIEPRTVGRNDLEGRNVSAFISLDHQSLLLGV